MRGNVMEVERVFLFYFHKRFSFIYCMGVMHVFGAACLSDFSTSGDVNGD
jgi:hypothetical protein